MTVCSIKGDCRVGKICIMPKDQMIFLKMSTMQMNRKKCYQEGEFMPVLAKSKQSEALQAYDSEREVAEYLRSKLLRK
jgi:hypothetical protein